jgi:DNA-binding GntR family transcriptional regulator
MSNRYSVSIPPHQSLSDTVLLAIRESILDRHLVSGERVSIDDLAKELEVSPTPVREALAALESEGLVLRVPHKGYTVAPTLTDTSLDQLYEVRLIIEPCAASLAALGASPEQMVEILGASAFMNEARERMMLDPGGRAVLTAYALGDRRFHEAIAVASGNPLLADMMVRLRPHPRIYRFYFSGGVAEEAIVEHDRILQAIENGLPNDARNAMIDHLEKARDRYRPWATRSEL